MRPLPQYPKAYLERLKLPQYEGAVPPEKMMADVTRIEALRKQKLETDRKIAYHNAESAELTRMTAKLMLYAGEPSYDGQVVDLLVQEEHDGHQSFVEILEAIRKEAPRLDLRRAQTYYTGLQKLGVQYRMAKKAYCDYTRPVLQASDNSGYGNPKVEYPGILILNTVNQLAPIARNPAMVVPSKRDVDRVNQPPPQPGKKGR